MAEHFPDAEPTSKRFVFGPATGAKIEARFKGDDPVELRRLAEQAKAIMREDPNAKDVRDDWRQPVPVIRPIYAETRARNASVSRPDLAGSLQIATTGSTVGLYREGDTLLPIVFRLAEADRSSVAQLDNAQVWSTSTGEAVPVRQVVSDMTTSWEDALIRRLDRRRTITVQADPRVGVASPVFERLRPKIEAIELPPGYELEWGGEYESAGDANRMLMASVPLFFSLMILIVVALFNSLRQPLIVFMTLPLAVIGVTAGLLVTGQPFGFVALLGFLSLSGMLIKNSVVLLDQIDINLGRGQAPLEAVLDAGVSRLRPVTMAAFTTVLGMTPLLFDRFWAAMAVTIMSGLAFATLLTLVVVPVLYAVFYRVASGPAPATRRAES
jgi:multidrug efflux pump subunit AcrB